jgi:hypothetical protein
LIERHIAIVAAMFGIDAMALQKIGNYGLIFGRDSRGKSILDCFPLTCCQIDTECLSERDEIASRMAITLGELIDEFSYASSSLGHHLITFVAPEFYLFVQRALQQRLKVRCHRWRFALSAFGIPALTGFELVLLRRPTWTDPVLRFGIDVGGGGCIEALQPAAPTRGTVTKGHCRQA